jgi:hypothetical protein
MIDAIPVMPQPFCLRRALLPDPGRVARDLVLPLGCTLPA